jgi:large subunit ribosomal protein L19
MDMTTLIKNKANPKIPALAPGDSVKVSAKIVEKGRQRVQVFNGVVIKVRRGADGGNFTIRRVARGVGVEHTFPFASPLVEKVEVVRRGKVRRARLFYMRGLSSKASRTKEKRLKESELKAEAEPEVEAEPTPELEPEAKAETEAKAEAEPTPEPEPEAEPEKEPEAKDEAEPQPEAELKKEPEAEAEPEPEAEAEAEPEPEEPEPEPEEKE